MDNKKHRKKKEIVTVALCAVLLFATFVSAFAGKSIYNTVIRFGNHEEIVVSEELKYIVVADSILSMENCKIISIISELLSSHILMMICRQEQKWNSSTRICGLT